ncbi:UDP-N-acetylmuramate--L-alanine ligase [Gordonia hirsuta DSM 44140 = NBRC 16056]|uniref:UDP-N-acetylmuramate--L-alanine ligase n=1 Tax=Gordonia hirsuta DSM 44140 = NBRC 16056 TaxID=1121927 RepID=L7L3Z9_9ACTN|nr:UDP-N-acetylmuramate--L-alanine ligase [Gordonia hirsuta]GAC55875.1 UDP-N-acetylmuramate--L-alanine ligase [Gordonia hirsuta DSM 44140 = NBRC 16056]
MSGPTEQLPSQLARVHMVGIGGAGMSGLARILLARGGAVSGSDGRDGRGLIALRARGAQVRIGHDPSALDLLDGGPTVVVTTQAAIPDDNPELVEARRRGIPILYRPQVLAQLMDGYRTLLITGTHGKTSTTSMTVVALQHCGIDPSFAIGGELNESGTNAHHGSGKVFVAEADESDGSLLQYRPDVVVVTNIEADHLDFFGSEDAYIRVFDEFAGLIRPGGALVVCLDDPGAAALAGRCHGALAEAGIQILGYGRGEHRDLAPQVRLAGELIGLTARGTGSVAQVRLQPPVTAEPADRAMRVSLPGEHMTLNAIGALLGCLAVAESVEPDTVLEGIDGFGGVHRRFENRGSVAGVRVYDDYAHHPTEVRAVLTAARGVVTETGGRVLAVFQPHLYSRTEEFADQFAQALSLADEVVVADVYGAREEPRPGVTGRLISEAVTVPAVFVDAVTDLPEVVAGRARTGDLVLTIGAGDITMQVPFILDALDS